MNIIEAMRLRSSVRTYKSEPLGETELQKLREAIASTYSPFGGDVSIRLGRFDLEGRQRPGTYGSISGASDYLLMAFGEGRVSALSAGFRMEQAVLAATMLGLGTCWLAGTFNGRDFDRGQVWPEGERLRIVSPVGYAADRRRIIERVFRKAAGSDGRKAFSQLFFTDRFRESLPIDSIFAEPLGMLRIAPSSANSQPWRVLVHGDEVSFYTRIDRTLSVLDCGIGICHFDACERFSGHGGEYFRSASPIPAPHGWTYLVSYRRK
ncbi:MAG: nitroreductase family protein [Duncaniella sp.]|nr:nitroreductase family protein [Duncaniella sp.]